MFFFCSIWRYPDKSSKTFYMSNICLTGLRTVSAELKVFLKHSNGIFPGG